MKKLLNFRVITSLEENEEVELEKENTTLKDFTPLFTKLVKDSLRWYGKAIKEGSPLSFRIEKY